MDTHVENIRQGVRQLTFKERKVQRDIVLNRQRGTSVFKDNPNLTPEVTANLAGKIKNKSSCTLQDYSLINQALIQNEENIAAFFKVDGALHSVVRDLTGQNAALQLQAANCCCNLSLGYQKHCTMVTKFAAPYLISYLEGLNIPLMVAQLKLASLQDAQNSIFVLHMRSNVTPIAGKQYPYYGPVSNYLEDVSAWTLGNLAGGDIKSWHILTSQGLLPKLLNHVNLSSAILQPAVYALAHYIHTGITEEVISEESLLKVTQHADGILKAEQHGYWVLYLLSCSPACSEQLLQMSLINYLLQILPTQEDISNITSMVRILGNLCTEGKAAAQFLESASVIQAVQFILSASQHHLHKEALWLLGNVTNNASAALQPHLQDLCNELENELSTVITKVNAEM